MTSLNTNQLQSIQGGVAHQVQIPSGPSGKIDLDDQLLERLEAKDPSLYQMLSRIRQIAARQQPLSHHLAHPRPRPILRVNIPAKRGLKNKPETRNYLTLAELREHQQKDPGLFVITRDALTDNVIRIIYDTAAAAYGEAKVDFDEIYEKTHRVFDRLVDNSRGFGGINVFTHLLRCTHQEIFGQPRQHRVRS